MNYNKIYDALCYIRKEEHAKIETVGKIFGDDGNCAINILKEAKAIGISGDIVWSKNEDKIIQIINNVKSERDKIAREERNSYAAQEEAYQAKRQADIAQSANNKAFWANVIAWLTLAITILSLIFKK